MVYFRSPTDGASSLLISWVNPFPSRFINITIFFCNALESHECARCLLSFLYFHWLFPLSASETSPGNPSIYKCTRERVDSKGLYERCWFHLMGSCLFALLIEANVCSPNPCKNGGLCKEMNGVATCECPPRYEGNFCESKFTII